MIRIAGGTPEHIEEYAAVVSQEVMQMSADLLQQTETLQCLLLIFASFPGGTFPVGDYMQPDGNSCRLRGGREHLPFVRHKLKEYRRAGKRFFLLNKIHLLVPQVVGFDKGLSLIVRQSFQVFKKKKLLMIFIISR